MIIIKIRVLLLFVLVNSCAWSTYENNLILAAGSSDGSITVITSDLNGYTYITQKAHENGVTSVSWSNPISSNNEPKSIANIETQYLLLATAGCNGFATIWNYSPYSKTFKLEVTWDHKSPVRDISLVNNDGLPYNLVATCTEDRNVRIFKKINENWKESKIIQCEIAIWKLSWNPLGNLLAVSAADNIVFIYEEKEEDNWELVVNTNKN